MKLSSLRTDCQSLYQRTNEIFNPRLEDTPINKSKYIKNKLSQGMDSSLTNQTYRHAPKTHQGPSEFTLAEPEDKENQLQKQIRINREQSTKIAALLALSDKQESNVSKYLVIIAEQKENITALKVVNQQQQQAIRERDTELQILRESMRHHIDNTQMKQQQQEQQELQRKLDQLQHQASRLQAQNQQLEQIIYKIQGNKEHNYKEQLVMSPPQQYLKVQNGSRLDTDQEMAMSHSKDKEVDLSGSLHDYKIVSESKDQLLSTSFLAQQRSSQLDSNIEFKKSSQNKEISNITQAQPSGNFDSGNMMYSSKSQHEQPIIQEEQSYQQEYRQFYEPQQQYDYQQYGSPPKEQQNISKESGQDNQDNTRQFFSGSSRNRTFRSNTRYQSNDGSYEQ